MSSETYIPVKNKNQLIIGVCGPTTSGKSTIISEILQRFGEFPVIGIEKFFNMKNPPLINLFGREIPNYDNSASVEWDLFYKEIEKQCDSPVLIIDSFVLFADHRAYELVDVCILIKYNVDTDFDVALQRRISRYPWRNEFEYDENYLQDPFKNKLNRQCAYFHEVAWPQMVNHPEFNQPKNWEKPILSLSATNDLQKNTKLALDFLKPYMNIQLNDI